MVAPNNLQRAVIDHIPLCWCEPETATAQTPRRLAIWLPGFGGTKESVEPQLRELAQHGFVALSYDPYQHGERGVESRDELVSRIISNIRRHFWPILTHTAEEVPRIIDWAVNELGVEEQVCMGGISMGGDISVAATGVDQRIACVSACIATADWMRPGSHEPPGQPDSYATMCYERRNPLTNLGFYRHCPAIAFECGALDTQVPPDGAQRFVAALASTYATCPQRLQVRHHDGIGHSFTEAMWQNSLKWFLEYSGTR